MQNNDSKTEQKVTVSSGYVALVFLALSLVLLVGSVMCCRFLSISNYDTGLIIIAEVMLVGAAFVDTRTSCRGMVFEKDGLRILRFFHRDTWYPYEQYTVIPCAVYPLDDNQEQKQEDYVTLEKANAQIVHILDKKTGVEKNIPFYYMSKNAAIRLAARAMEESLTYETKAKPQEVHLRFYPDQVENTEDRGGFLLYLFLLVVPAIVFYSSLHGSAIDPKMHFMAILITFVFFAISFTTIFASFSRRKKLGRQVSVTVSEKQLTVDGAVFRHEDISNVLVTSPFHPTQDRAMTVERQGAPKTEVFLGKCRLIQKYNEHGLKSIQTIGFFYPYLFMVLLLTKYNYTEGIPMKELISIEIEEMNRNVVSFRGDKNK
ncbi:MAG TPA: hypothetical protein PK567_01915 [Bacillota bacterium]|nr:hypothetical protein [Bacillota bacterium]